MRGNKMEKEKITVHKAITYFINEIICAGLAKSTAEAYNTDLQQFKEYLKGKHIKYINKVEVNHISKFRELLLKDKKLKRTTIERKISSLSAFFHLLEDHGYIQKNKNPIRKLIRKKMKKDDKAPFFLEKEEIEAIIEGAGKSRNGTRDIAMFTLMAYSGARRSDVLALDWHHINFKDREIRMYRTKNQTESIIPMRDNVFDTFVDLYEEIRPNINDPVFSSELGNRLSNGAFNQAFRNAVLRSGVKKSFKITSHIFRHSFCTELVKNGVSIAQIAKFTGHTDLGSLKTYTHVSTQDQRDIIDKLYA